MTTPYLPSHADGPLNAQCVASTEAPSVDSPDNQHQFKEAQWSADGTCVVTNSTDNCLRTYVLPVDLLEPNSSTPHTLTSYSSIPSPSPIRAYALHPSHTLSSPSTTLVLTSTSDLPLRLSNTLHPTTHATYTLIHPTTERYIAPHSLLFTQHGTRFVTGSDSLLCVFDIARSAGTGGPLSRHPTIPSKRHKLVGGGVGIKGIVSALGVSSEGLLAAGTFTRCVGLYASEGEGDTVGVFSVAGEERCQGVDIGGGGITQCLWSPCGRYLYVVERKSDGAIVYDVRVAGKRLGVLTGRGARTNQRLVVHVAAPGGGDADAEDRGGAHEVWAGGTDGVVRVWRSPHLREGAVAPDERFQAHEDAVTSAVVHPFAGNILATCSGQRRSVWLHEDDEEDGEDTIAKTGDCGLKIWTV